MDLLDALKQILNGPGEPALTLGPIEEDGSLGVMVAYDTQVGRMRTITAVASLDDLAEFLGQSDDWLDPR
jgi:hypothetical protein